MFGAFSLVADLLLLIFPEIRRTTGPARLDFSRSTSAIALRKLTLLTLSEPQSEPCCSRTPRRQTSVLANRNHRPHDSCFDTKPRWNKHRSPESSASGQKRGVCRKSTPEPSSLVAICRRRVEEAVGWNVVLAEPNKTSASRILHRRQTFLHRKGRCQPDCYFGKGVDPPIFISTETWSGDGPVSGSSFSTRREQFLERCFRETPLQSRGFESTKSTLSTRCVSCGNV